MSLDELILTLTTVSHGPKVDIYDLLSEYVGYIHKKKTPKTFVNEIKD